MADQSHFKEVATALWTVLYNFRNHQVEDRHYQVGRRFKDGKRVIIDLTLSYPVGDVFCSDGCCNCKISVIPDQVMRGTEKFIRRLCWNVENVAAYRIFNSPEDPRITVLQLCERSDGRHQSAEDFLMCIAKVITRNIDHHF